MTQTPTKLMNWLENFELRNEMGTNYMIAMYDKATENTLSIKEIEALEFRIDFEEVQDEMKKECAN